MIERSGAYDTIANQINLKALKVGARYKTDIFLAYFQNETNTIGDIEWLRARYDEAFNHRKIKGVVISTRPDMISEQVFDMLAIKQHKKPVFLEFGLQSIHSQTLKRINRGHDFEDFNRVLQMASERRIPVAVHIILGLPGETPEMMIETCKILAQLPIDSIKLHHLQIYRDAPLEADWYQNKIKLFDSFEDYLPVVCDCLEVLPWRIKIQRLVADSPKTYLLAPGWDINKNQIIKGVEDELARRGTKQGSKS